MAMLAVAGVAITTVTIFVGATTRAQFAQYVEAGRELRQDRFEQAVIVWGDSNNQTETIDVFSSLPFLTDGTESAPANFRIRRLGRVAYLEQVHVDTTGAFDGEVFRLEIAPDGELVVYQGEEIVGTLFIDPVPTLELQLAEQVFFDTINWTLLITSVVAGIAAITLTVILSRRILHPVAALTLAARHMESGDFEQRVNVQASGEIGELAHAFNAMAEALNRHESLRRNMVTDIAHELRTPLTNIRGYLEAIQDGVLEANIDTVNMLHDEAVMLNQLIQDLQELALAEAGALQIDPRELAVESVVEQTITAALPGARKKDVRLVSKLPDDIPVVYADQRRVGQVLRNLINNAITHTPADGEVTVSADIYPNEIEVTVHDTGEGIDSDHLPYLFERFYRADPSRSRTTGGAGLGLAIVKNLVESQGGRVQVSSVKGKGATFSFTLPRQLIPIL